MVPHCVIAHCAEAAQAQRRNTQQEYLTHTYSAVQSHLCYTTATPRSYGGVFITTCTGSIKTLILLLNELLFCQTSDFFSNVHLATQVVADNRLATALGLSLSFICCQMTSDNSVC